MVKERGGNRELRRFPPFVFRAIPFYSRALAEAFFRNLAYNPHAK